MDVPPGRGRLPHYALSVNRHMCPTWRPPAPAAAGRRRRAARRRARSSTSYGSKLTVNQARLTRSVLAGVLGSVQLHHSAAPPAGMTRWVLSSTAVPLKDHSRVAGVPLSYQTLSPRPYCGVSGNHSSHRGSLGADTGSGTGSPVLTIANPISPPHCGVVVSPTTCCCRCHCHHTMDLVWVSPAVRKLLAEIFTVLPGGPAFCTLPRWMDGVRATGPPR